MKYMPFFFLIICLTVFSCQSTRVMSPQQYEGQRLILSHGGGFAGTYKTYHLLDNGQVFRRTSEFDTLETVKDLPRRQAEQIFSNYKVLGFGSEKVQSYGNLNYSITMISKDGHEHKLIWEKNQNGAEKLQLFYTNVMNQIKLNRAEETMTTK